MSAELELTGDSGDRSTRGNLAQFIELIGAAERYEARHPAFWVRAVFHNGSIRVRWGQRDGDGKPLGLEE